MTTAIWLPPLIRALTTALLVLSASVAAEMAGPFWGALIASLPVSAGPAYVFLAMQTTRISLRPARSAAASRMRQPGYF